ncbi:MAG: DUF5711 family protein [Lachnospiraceae bacterium]|nr:DUF5711 family protein [Lachnospiraceae bacterium]
MDKDKWKKTFSGLIEKLAFLKPWETEDEDGLEIQEMDLSEKKKTLTAEERMRRKGYAIVGAIVLVLLVAGSFFYYNSHHLFTEYVITDTTENMDIVGTQYTVLGENILKYSPDGVFCVNRHDEMKWSVAYSMQTPITDICEGSMVIAEQQGNQVYVLNQDGAIGHFETTLPIMKAQISEQGVVVLLLSDKDVTWIELYDASGSELVKVKTTVDDSGYPLDVAISKDASHMMVSYLGIYQGTLGSKIAFYDFSSVEAVDTSHLTGTLEYPGRIFPEIYYADDTTPVAQSDVGFVVFEEGDVPVEKEQITLEREIISSFHDDKYIGFVFSNDETTERYQMELYRYNGRRAMQETLDCDYTEIMMDSGEILLYDEKNCTVYSTSGVKRFSSDYEKQINYFMAIPGFRKYLVITDDSMDTIRIS